MGSVHSFEHRAVARLRARLGAVEEANQDLIAFARGHHGTVAAIHRAVLLAIQAGDLAELLNVVTGEWPEVLGIDHSALAVAGTPTAIVAAADMISPIDGAILRRALRGLGPVALRDVDRGHPFFGHACAAIRAEAVIRVDLPSGKPVGLLLLGQGRSPGLDEHGGSELLRFLGQSLGAMIARWRDQAAG
jgi:uncharacterized protein YigA (DUF484 family)